MFHKNSLNLVIEELWTVSGTFLQLKTNSTLWWINCVMATLFYFLKHTLSCHFIKYTELKQQSCNKSSLHEGCSVESRWFTFFHHFGGCALWCCWTVSCYTERCLWYLACTHWYIWVRQYIGKICQYNTTAAQTTSSKMTNQWPVKSTPQKQILNIITFMIYCRTVVLDCIAFSSVYLINCLSLSVLTFLVTYQNMCWYWYSSVKG